jgi:hypothetical protein
MHSRCCASLKYAHNAPPAPPLLDVSPAKRMFTARALTDLPSAYATVQSDIFKPTKYGGKYTVTLIPGKDSLVRLRFYLQV